MIEDIKALSNSVGKITATIDQALASSQKQVTDLTTALETDRQAHALVRNELATVKATVASQTVEIADLKSQITTAKAEAEALAIATVASAAKVDTTIAVKAAAIAASQGIPPLALKPEALPGTKAESKLKGRERLVASIEAELNPA